MREREESSYTPTSDTSFMTKVVMGILGRGGGCGSSNPD